MPGKWWFALQPCLVHSVTSPTCLRVQDRQVPTPYCFVALIRWPLGGDKEQLNLACTRAPPRRSQNKHTVWMTSDHSRALPDQIHKWQTERVFLAGTRAPLALLLSVSPHITAHPMLCDQSSQPVSLRVNPTHWSANSNQGSSTTGRHTNPHKQYSWSITRLPGRQCYQAQQDTYYIRPYCQDWEM